MCDRKNCGCRQCCSAPTCSNANEPTCHLSSPVRYQLKNCDQTFISRKDHLYPNTRCGRCSWVDRYDDQFWNTKFGIPIYATRFDAPSPVKPPWCPPGCKTRSYLYPRQYKRNCDGWYPDECRCKPKCFVSNPRGTDVGGPSNFCGKRWSIPLCPCPLVGKSRCFPPPCACGCVPSPACVPKRLQCCVCQPECNKCIRQSSYSHEGQGSCIEPGRCPNIPNIQSCANGGCGRPRSFNYVPKGYVPTSRNYDMDDDCCCNEDDFCCM